MENHDLQKTPRPTRRNWIRLSFGSSASHSSKYRADIDGLRAIAVLAVLCFHVGITAFQGGFVGVDVFYVISGYLITSLLLKDLTRDRFSIVSFYERRMRRIFPALFVVLFFCILAAWARTRLGLWLLLMTAVSFGLNLWASQYKTVLAFYWFPPRAWELLIGALVSIRIVPAIPNRIARELAGLLGLAAIVISVLLPITNWSFPGYIVLLPCLGTGLVIYTGESGQSLARTILSFPPLVFLGAISYSLYLWHWPLIVFSRHLPFHFSDNNDLVLVLVSSIVFAFISFEFIERPFRGGSSPFNRRQIFAFGAAASLVTAAFGTAAFLSHGLPERYDSQTRQVVASNLERMEDFDESCGNWKNEIHRLADVRFCSLGDQFSHKIMFWGDSHVQQLYPVIKEIYSERSIPNRGVVLALASGCLPDERLNNTGDGFYCDSFAKFVMMRAKEEDIDTVFVGFSTWWASGNSKRWAPGDNKFFCIIADGKCGPPLSDSDLNRNFLRDFSEEIRELRALGKRVIVCLPFPIYDEPIPQLEISDAVFGKFGLSETARDITSPLLREQIKAAAVDADAEIFDPRESLCQGQRCLFEVNGVSIYKDESHLTSSGALVLTASLRRILQTDAGQTQLVARDPMHHVAPGFLPRQAPISYGSRPRKK